MSEQPRQPMTRRELRELRQRQEAEEQARLAAEQSETKKPAEDSVEVLSSTEVAAEPAPEPEKAPEKPRRRSRRAMDTPVDAPSLASGRVPRIMRAQQQEFEQQQASDQPDEGQGSSWQSDEAAPRTGMLPTTHPVPEPMDLGDQAKSRREARALRARAYAESVRDDDTPSGGIFAPAGEKGDNQPETSVDFIPRGHDGDTEFAQRGVTTQDTEETDAHAQVGESSSEITGLHSVMDTEALEREQLQQEIAQLQQEIMNMGQQNPNVIDTRVLNRQQELAAKMAALRQREAETVISEEEYTSRTEEVPKPAQPTAQPEHRLEPETKAPSAPAQKVTRKDPVGAHSAHGLDPLDARESGAADRRVMIMSNLVLLIGIILVIIAVIMFFVN